MSEVILNCTTEMKIFFLKALFLATSNISSKLIFVQTSNKKENANKDRKENFIYSQLCRLRANISKGDELINFHSADIHEKEKKSHSHPVDNCYFHSADFNYITPRFNCSP